MPQGGSRRRSGGRYFLIPPRRGGWRAKRAGWDSAMANERARQLRKSMTRQEVKLWMHLRSWRRRGFHFRRQAPRDGYILILSASPNGSLLKLMADSTILMIMHR